MAVNIGIRSPLACHNLYGLLALLIQFGKARHFHTKQTANSRLCDDIVIHM